MHEPALHTHVDDLDAGPCRELRPRVQGAAVPPVAALPAEWLPQGQLDAAIIAAAAALGMSDVSAAACLAVELDQAALDNIRAIDDDGSVLADVMNLYLKDAPGQLQSLRNALEGGRLADLGRTAHALRSASLNVGAKALCELCGRLERQAKACEGVGTAELVAGIEALMEPVRAALLVELAHLPGGRADLCAAGGVACTAAAESA